MSNNGFVATTVNPFGDIENQTACFNSWKRAGYSVKTFNAKKEADLLLKNGFENTDIVTLEDSQTTYATNKKYLPRVRPIIEQLAERNQDVIITNSDIFALHAIPLTGVLKSLAPSFAITRREVLSLSMVDPRDNEFYRGGLDLFFLSSGSLKQLKGELKNCEAADSMAFGVPGWDYLMGALVEKRLGGEVCDGPIVAHKYHKNTYSGLESFDIYARDIARLLSLEKSEPYWVANQYAHRINELCKANVKIRSSLQSFYHPNGANKLMDASGLSEVVLTDIDNVLANANPNRLKQVINKIKDNGDWGFATQFIPGCFVRTLPVTANLFTLLNYLSQVELKEATTIYPPNSLHGKAIENIKNGPKEEQLNQVLDVFSIELVGSNIFNHRLYDFLVWSCTNKTQLEILKKIKLLTGVA